MDEKREVQANKETYKSRFPCFAFEAMQMRISLFEPWQDIALYLKIHSLQELLNGTGLLPIPLAPLPPPFGLAAPWNPVV